MDDLAKTGLVEGSDLAGPHPRSSGKFVVGPVRRRAGKIELQFADLSGRFTMRMDNLRKQGTKTLTSTHPLQERV